MRRAEHRVRAQAGRRGGQRPADRLLRRRRRGERRLARGDGGRPRSLRRRRDAADRDLLNEDWVRDGQVPPTASGYHENWYPPYLPHTGSGGMGVRRELHEAIGGFDESYSSCEDNDYCFPVAARGVELGSVEGAVYLPLQGRSGRSSGRPTGTRRTMRGSSSSTAPAGSAEAVDVGHQVLAGAARCAPRGCHQAGPRADGVDARMGARPAPRQPQVPGAGGLVCARCGSRSQYRSTGGRRRGRQAVAHRRDEGGAGSRSGRFGQLCGRSTGSTSSTTTRPARRAAARAAPSAGPPRRYGSSS